MKHAILKRFGHRILAVLLAIALLAQLGPIVPIHVWAAEAPKKITTAEDLPAEIPAGVTYELAADITLGADQQITSVAGTLDGKGHTITLTGKPLIKEVTGIVQNLLVAGKATVNSLNGSITCSLKGGFIMNCGSTVDIDPGWSDRSGGLVGASENGKILNCYFAGTGKDMFGITAISGIMGASDNKDAPSILKNCYYTAGYNLGGGYAWNTGDPSNGKKTVDAMKAPEFVELLNTNIPFTGFYWVASEGGFPTLAVDTVHKPEKPGQANKEALAAAMKDAQAKEEKDYTPDSFRTMKDALDAAKTVFEDPFATQIQVDDAAKALAKALTDLVAAVKNLSPVPAPSTGVIEISSVSDFAKISSTDATKFYRLTNDLVIESNFFAKNLAGVFDGNGHTITIRTNQRLFNTILDTGVVQNLSIKVEGNYPNRQIYAPVADNLKGLIVNCISNVVGQHAAGFVKKMTSGIMSNCLFMGHCRRGAFVHYQFSTDHANTNGYKSGTFHNCYWAASTPVENIPLSAQFNSAPVGDTELRSSLFIEQLNAQKGLYGSTWVRDAEGYPAFGQDHGEHVIDGSKNLYPLQFVWHNSSIPVDVTGGELILSPQMTDSMRFAGTFQLKNVPEGSTITWSCEDRASQNVMQLYEENGQLYVFADGGGVVRATEHLPDGTTRLAAEIRVISASQEIEELQLVMDGKVINGSATVQGSADKVLTIQARFAGETQFKTIPSYLAALKSHSGLIYTTYNSSNFHFKKPGTDKLTVTAKNGVSITVELTSEYVPIRSITPAISGNNLVHSRNSMGRGQFNSFYQTVIIEPANASYKYDFTVESSDPNIAEYSNSSYTPYKAGTVTFTAKANDNGKIITGTSTATFSYRNPLVSVTGSSEPITLEPGARAPLNLTFTGELSNFSVTETELVWSFDKEGIVSISRPDPLMQIRDSSCGDAGDWVASTNYEVKALRPGTVVATGTPVDTGKNAKPVVITITVKDNGQEIPVFDIDKFIQDGKNSALQFLNSNNTFNFGEEWIIYALLRDGQFLPQAKLNSYYDSLVSTVTSWQPSVKSTEIERAVLALSIMGKDITNVEGVNLAAMIYNHPDLTDQGSNAVIWALIALDMRNTQIPGDAVWTREKLISELLTYQDSAGAFSLEKGSKGGIDVTAMALQALAPYRNQQEVSAAMEKALAYLARAVEQGMDLGNSESISQVIIALSVLGKDLAKEPGFGDATENLMSALAEYMVMGEGFKHDKNNDLDKMSTVQAYHALCAYERLLKGESSYWDLIGRAPVADPVDEVIALIDALPENVTLADFDAIRAVRERYNSLTPTQQMRVTNIDKLENAEFALKQLMNHQNVIDKINAIPDTVTAADAETVRAARDAYELLPESEKALVTNLDKLLKAEETIRDIEAAKAVMSAISKLPDKLQFAHIDSVIAARDSYNKLTDAQKKLVTNLDKLEKAEKDVLDLQAAQKVMESIHALPRPITLSASKAVSAARKAYNALTKTQKELVLNLYLLEGAEAELKDLVAVKNVVDAINALPKEITLADAEAIRAAHNAYGALSPALKKQVTNLDILRNAEKALSALIEEADKPTQSNVVEAVVVDGVVSAQQLEEVMGKDLILKISGELGNGERYTLTIHGKDIAKAQQMVVGMNRKDLHTGDINKLAENAEIFRFVEAGAFPGTTMVEMDSQLADGEYLLLRYNVTERRAEKAGKAIVKDGKAQFLVSEGGEYFLAKKASSKSVAELEAEETRPENTQPTLPQQEQSNSGLWILITVLTLCAAAAVVVIVVIVKKRKGDDHEKAE